jgi:hypothetical protein
MEILLKDTQHVITENEFRQLHSNTSFPQLLTSEILNDYNAVAIMEGPQASPSNRYEYSQRDGIQEINGQWFTKYSIGPKFETEEQLDNYKKSIDDQAAQSVRLQRDQLLKDSDWTQVADAPVDKKAWATYRQLLRDITTQETFPYDIVWPQGI